MRPFEVTQFSELMRGVLDAVPEGLLVTDTDERIVYANPQLLRMTGYSEHELIGSTPRVFQGPETSEESRQQIRDALQSGKRIRGISLSMSPMRDADGEISHFVSCLRDVSFERARIERLYTLASIDDLTGLSNRRHFLDRAKNEAEKANRYRRPLSVILFDVDRFKSLNDDSGHAFGDQVLSRIGAICKRIIRRTDLLGRIGGDEFAVLLPETAHAPAIWTADRLRRLVREEHGYQLHDRLQITISLGVATLNVHVNESLAECLARADAALYRAKASGRDACAGDRSGSPAGRAASRIALSG
jgi:diguanylate cyclase (GGDEF)-like protein/PAS domain S-box-containing protein